MLTVKLGSRPIAGCLQKYDIATSLTAHIDSIYSAEENLTRGDQVGEDVKECRGRDGKDNVS
jgi:hypothetical protein